AKASLRAGRPGRLARSSPLMRSPGRGRSAGPRTGPSRTPRRWWRCCCGTRPAADELRREKEGPGRGRFRREAFAGFGPFGLTNDEAPLTTVRARGPRRLRKAMRQHCPRLPGVYGMLDAAGELIYVGKARSLRGRLLSYFRPSRDDKAG